MSAVGRDQLGPIERLVRVLAVLENAGERGAVLDKLLEAAQYGADDPDDQRRMLGKDIAHLNNAGWDIENVAAAGTDARWVLRTRDIRLRVELTPAQQAELARAARVGGVDDFADYVGVVTEPPDQAAAGAPTGEPDVHLVLCLEATAQRRKVQFIYKRRPRTVHPRVVQPGPSGWYLVGWEQASGIEKSYVIARVDNLVLGKPGTAQPAADSAARWSIDPATWEIDPPTDVYIETTPDFAEQVKLAMRPVLVQEDEGGRTVLTIRVTNRAAFRNRLYALGARVRVLGPDDVRAEIVEELSRMAAVA